MNRLIELASDSNWEIRYRSLEMLADYSPCESIKDQLLASLDDEEEVVRSQAAESLEGYDDPDVSARLVECLEDSSSIVRGSAAQTLGYNGVREQTPTLRDRLRLAEDPERVPVLVGLLYLVPIREISF